MLCPKCRLTMREGAKPGELFCPGCGYRSSADSQKASSGLNRFPDPEVDENRTEVQFQPKKKQEESELARANAAEKEKQEEARKEKERIEKEEEERIKKEHEEMERRAKKELERKIQEEEDRKAQDEAEEVSEEKEISPSIESAPEADVQMVVKEIKNRNKEKPKTSISKRKKRVEKAQRITELRRLSRDLVARINDIEIQFDRRLEDLQTLAVKLQEVIEGYED